MGQMFFTLEKSNLENNVLIKIPNFLKLCLLIFLLHKTW